MKRLVLLNMALSAGLLVATAQAQPEPPDAPRGHWPPPPPLLVALDTNHDGVIDAGEIANASAALKSLDKNGDGQLTPDELRPPPPSGTNQPPLPPPPAGRKHPVSPIMAALDTNGDGILEADEIANASASLLKLDKNGDGQLTRDELRPKGFGRPPGPPPPPPDAGSSGAMKPSDGSPDGPADMPPPPDVVD